MTTQLAWNDLSFVDHPLVVGGITTSHFADYKFDELSRLSRGDFYCDVVRGIDGRFDVNNQCNNGNTALMYAARENHLDVARWLVRQPDINVNMCNNLGWSALMFAVDRGNEKIVRLLVNQHDIKLNIECNLDGSTALIVAASRGYTNIVEMLLASDSIDVNKQNVVGWSPLMLACFENYKKIVQLLLQKVNINLNVRNKQGVTAIMMAAMKGNAEIVWMLLAHDSQQHVHASWFPNASISSFLVDRAVSSAELYRRIIISDAWNSRLPASNLASIVTMAFGNEIIVAGPNRSDPNAIETLLLQIANN